MKGVDNIDILKEETSTLVDRISDINLDLQEIVNDCGHILTQDCLDKIGSVGALLCDIAISVALTHVPDENEDEYE